MPRLEFFVAGAVPSTFEASAQKSVKRIGILRSRADVSFLKEVSQKRCVFEFQSFTFKGSFAVKHRFLSLEASCSKEARRKVSFLSFKAPFLKEVSHKSRETSFKKSRTKASFLSFKASLKEVLRKKIELQNSIFEGRLAEKFRLTKSFESHIS